MSLLFIKTNVKFSKLGYKKPIVWIKRIKINFFYLKEFNSVTDFESVLVANYCTCPVGCNSGGCQICSSGPC